MEAAEETDGPGPKQRHDWVKKHTQHCPYSGMKLNKRSTEPESFPHRKVLRRLGWPQRREIKCTWGTQWSGLVGLKKITLATDTQTLYSMRFGVSTTS